jgi:hypothetical protein
MCLIVFFQQLRKKGSIEESGTWFLMLAVMLQQLACLLLVRLASKNATEADK